MSKLNESNTQKTDIQKGGWKLFLIEVLIGVGVMFLWAPAAYFIGITQPWVSIIFIIGWVIFWGLPAGQRLRSVLVRQINGG